MILKKYLAVMNFGTVSSQFGENRQVLSSEYD